MRACGTIPASSRDRVTRFQNRKLRVLVDHAYRRVPLYRRLFDEAGLAPRDVRSAADLARLPITTKGEMRLRPVEDLVAQSVRDASLITRCTTGSTGEPARVRRTEFADHLLQQFRLRARRLAGGKLRDRTLGIRSRGVPTDKKPRSRRAPRVHPRRRGGVGRGRESGSLAPIHRRAGLTVGAESHRLSLAVMEDDGVPSRSAARARGHYDSSLMGYEHPYTFRGLIELPVSWTADDATYFFDKTELGHDMACRYKLSRP